MKTMAMTPLQLAIYERLLSLAKSIGDFDEDPKQTSIHLTRQTAFAGVATRKNALVVTIKLPADVRSPRIVKRQRASARRWYLDVRLESPKEVDGELREWLKDAMALSS
jgi:hypothetical protein